MPDGRPVIPPRDSLFAFRNWGSWKHPDLFIAIGPWAVRIAAPYYGAVFGNGSSWWSGWHRWREQP